MVFKEKEYMKERDRCQLEQLSMEDEHEDHSSNSKETFLDRRKCGETYMHGSANYR